MPTTTPQVQHTGSCNIAEVKEREPRSELGWEANRLSASRVGYFLCANTMESVVRHSW